MVTRLLEKLILVFTALNSCRHILLGHLMSHEFDIKFSAGLVCVAVIISCIIPSKFPHPDAAIRKDENGVLYCWLLPIVSVFNLRWSANDDSQHALHVLMMLGTAQVTSTVTMCLIVQYKGSRYFGTSWRTLISVWLLPLLGTAAFSKLGDWSLLAVGATSGLFAVSLAFIFTTFPQTFSYGEGVIICQALSTFSLHSIHFTHSLIYIQGASASYSESDSYDFISMAALMMLSLPVLVYATLRDDLREPIIFYTLFCCSACLLVVFTWSTGHLPRVIIAIYSQRAQMLLLVYWIIITVLSLALVMTYNQHGKTANSTVRKYFHALAILIFLPGIMIAPQLTKLASVGALALFVLVEFVRYQKMTGVGEIIDKYLRVFLDGQDSGSLILTHIYLLIGCSLPLWLSSPTQLTGGGLHLFAGIISLGVGDSFASIVGRWVGRIRYPGSIKTMEGTVAAWLSMTLACYTLLRCFMTSDYDSMLLIRVSLKCLMISLLESSTKQVDNLVLPLYAYVIFLIP